MSALVGFVCSDSDEQTETSISTKNQDFELFSSETSWKFLDVFKAKKRKLCQKSNKVNKADVDSRVCSDSTVFYSVTKPAELWRDVCVCVCARISFIRM